MTIERECFSCGATQAELVERDLGSEPRPVWLCADCIGLYRAAGLLSDPPPSDFASKLRTALDTPAPGSSPLTG